MDKNEVYPYLHDGLSCEEVLKKAFSNLNKYRSLGLRDSTIDRASTDLSTVVENAHKGKNVYNYPHHALSKLIVFSVSY